MLTGDGYCLTALSVYIQNKNLTPLHFLAGERQRMKGYFSTDQKDSLLLLFYCPMWVKLRGLFFSTLVPLEGKLVSRQVVECLH